MSKITNKEWLRRRAKRALPDDSQCRQSEEELPRPPILWGYIRCSHQDSKDSGLGEDAQHNMTVRWAELLRSEKPHLPSEIKWCQEDDPVSAYKVQFRFRPAGSKLFRNSRGGDHVIFAYLDRAFRDTEDCLTTLREFKRRGIIAHFANLRIDMDSAVGEMMITIMAAVAQMESKMKSERIKEVLAGLAVKGRMANGHAPMGFKLSGPKGKRRAAVCDREARRIMGEIVRVRDKHRWSWGEISDYVEKWLAEQAGRKPTPAWEKRNWSAYRCQRAYDAELALRNGKHETPQAG